VGDTPQKLVVDIDTVVPWDRNPREISRENFDKLKRKIQRWGIWKPFLVWESKKVILGGNQQYRACKELGHTELWVEYREPKDEAEALEMAITDNESSGRWDMGELISLTDQYSDRIQLDDYEIDIKYQGLRDILPQEVEEDDYEEPEEVVTDIKRGDVILLGKHRLMCGDSTSKEDVEKLMDGKKADMVFTDPPYGMNLDTDYTKMGDGGKKYNSVIADGEQFDASFLLGYFNYCKELFLWGADYYVETLHREYPSLGSWVVWDKYSDHERNGLLDGKFGSAFEMCWSKTPHKREVARVLVTTNYTARGDESRVHPTQKPVALSVWFLNRWGKEGGLIVDIFGGSGSTLIACEQTNRVCYMMEIDPKYCELICLRWEKYTGGERRTANGDDT
jgi:DNA modification methylase